MKMTSEHPIYKALVELEKDKGIITSTSMRGPQTRKNAVHVLRTRLESELSEIDWWFEKNRDLGEEFMSKMLQAQRGVHGAIELVAACEELMVEEER